MDVSDIHCESCGQWLPAIVDRMNTWCREQGVAELRPWDWKAESVHHHINYMHGAINGRFHDREEKSSASHARLVAAARELTDAIRRSVKTDPQMSGKDLVRGIDYVQFQTLVLPAMGKTVDALAEVEGA